MRERQPAICLGVTDYSETSQVVHFLTRGAGPVRLIAKGSKRPKSKSGGAIDLLSEGETVYIASRGEGLGTLVEFTETEARPALRKDAGALDAALFMVEAAGRLLAPGDPHPEVFDLLHNSLQRVGQADAPKDAVLAYFLWRLLRHAGLLGELRACVSCGVELRPTGTGETGTVPGAVQPGIVPASPNGYSPRFPQREPGTVPVRGAVPIFLHFSSTMGGLLCPECEGAAVEKYRLDGPTLAALAALPAAEAGKRVALPPPQAQGVLRLLAYHIAHQTGRPLRMAARWR